MCEIGNESGDIKYKVLRKVMVLVQCCTVSICKKQNVELIVLYMCPIPLYDLRDFHLSVPGTF